MNPELRAACIDSVLANQRLAGIEIDRNVAEQMMDKVLMTERTTRDDVADILHIYEPMDFQEITKLARSYLALLDENRILSRAIQDIAFGNLSHNEIERIASDAWYTAKEVTSGTD